MTFRTGAALAALAAGLVLAWLARDALLLAFFGVVVGVVFSFPVGWLARFLPRGLAVLLVVLALLGALAGAAAILAPLVAKQAGEISASLPRAKDKALGWLRQHGEDPGKIEDQAGNAAGKAASIAMPAAAGLASALTALVLVTVLGAFLVSKPDLYRHGVRRLVPREHEAAFDELWARTGTGLRKWVGGILVSMLIMGVLTGAGLWAAGIEGWPLLALLTFAGTFVPYVGAIASAIPGLAVALTQSPHHLALALLVYLGVHVVEGYLVQPLVMRRAVELKPAWLLIGQCAFAAVFGLAGAVVATPLLVCARIATHDLWEERRLGKPREE